jgi:hypothetical protein
MILKVNNKQKTLLLQHLGCARWAFNFALAIKKEEDRSNTRLNGIIEK